MTCSVDGCEREVRAKNFCIGHYSRWAKSGDPGAVDFKVGRPRVVPTPCSVDGCSRTRRAGGMCNMHWKRWKQNGDPGPAESTLRDRCTVEGCSGTHHARGFCHHHLSRARRYGDPLHIGEHRVGPLHPKWSGDEASYGAIHFRIKKARGPASDHECQHCGGMAAEWAYDHDDFDAKIQIDGPNAGAPYSLDVSHYVSLCVRCHRTFDLAQRAC